MSKRTGVDILFLMSNATTTDTIGYDLNIGDITIDLFGSRYIITDTAAFIEGFDAPLIGRRDLNLIDGDWIATGRIYNVDADNIFMVI